MIPLPRELRSKVFLTSILTATLQTRTLIPVLQAKKLRLTEVKWFTQRFTTDLGSKVIKHDLNGLCQTPLPQWLNQNTSQYNVPAKDLIILPRTFLSTTPFVLQNVNNKSDVIICLANENKNPEGGSDMPKGPGWVGGTARTRLLVLWRLSQFPPSPLYLQWWCWEDLWATPWDPKSWW